MWAGSQRQPLNIPVLVSGAAGPASCPWVAAVLVTLSDQKWECEIQETEKTVDGVREIIERETKNASVKIPH